VFRLPRLCAWLFACLLHGQQWWVGLSLVDVPLVAAGPSYHHLACCAANASGGVHAYVLLLVTVPPVAACAQATSIAPLTVAVACVVCSRRRRRGAARRGPHRPLQHGLPGAAPVRAGNWRGGALVAGRQPPAALAHGAARLLRRRGLCRPHDWCASRIRVLLFGIQNRHLLAFVQRPHSDGPCGRRVQHKHPGRGFHCTPRIAYPFNAIASTARVPIRHSKMDVCPLVGSHRILIPVMPHVAVAP
jgi:hypothetical protein